MENCKICNNAKKKKALGKKMEREQHLKWQENHEFFGFHYLPDLLV